LLEASFLIAILAGLFGLLIGSFLNVCIYRLPRDLSVVRPRSHCPECEHLVAWYDNVPLVSFAILGARCRNCRTAIPWRYPIVEFLTAALFFAIVWKLGPTLAALKGCIFAAILVELIFSDFETLILPDEFTLGGTALGLVFSYFVPLPLMFSGLLVPYTWKPGARSVVEAVIAAGFISLLFWAFGKLYFVIRKREGLGLGDVKMVALMGAFLGLQMTLLALVIGSLLGSVVGLLFIAITRKDSASYELPFGSFLGIGGLAIMLLQIFRGLQ
jgi:leader peptidase (prepilin peptidase) / N-methyltransferase